MAKVLNIRHLSWHAQYVFRGYPIIPFFIELFFFSDIDIALWEKMDDKCDTRKICYTYNMPGAIGPKSCGIMETHVRYLSFYIYNGAL